MCSPTSKQIQASTHKQSAHGRNCIATRGMGSLFLSSAQLVVMPLCTAQHPRNMEVLPHHAQLANSVTNLLLTLVFPLSQRGPSGFEPVIPSPSKHHRIDIPTRHSRASGNPRLSG